MQKNGKIKPISRLKTALWVVGFIWGLFSFFPVKADLVSAIENYKSGQIQKAVMEWENLASYGNPDAFYNLGQVYRIGIGRPIDSARAVYFYRRAAESGHPQAQGNLAVLHYFGEGTPINKGEAIRWWRSAARKGHGQSQLALAILYFKGEGVPKDNIQAFGWAYLAEKNGIRKAKNLKLIMRQHLTQNEMFQGEILSKGLVDPGLNPRASQMVIAEPSDASPQIEIEAMETIKAEETTPPKSAEKAQPAIEPYEEPENVKELQPMNEPDKNKGMEPKKETQDVRPTISEPKNDNNFNWYIQLGAFRDESRAKALREKLSAGEDVPIAHLTPYIMVVDLGADKGVFYRLRFGGFFNKIDGERICEAYAVIKQACVVVPK